MYPTIMAVHNISPKPCSADVVRTTKFRSRYTICERRKESCLKPYPILMRRLAQKNGKEAESGRQKAEGKRTEEVKASGDLCGNLRTRDTSRLRAKTLHSSVQARTRRFITKADGAQVMLVTCFGYLVIGMPVLEGLRPRGGHCIWQREAPSGQEICEEEGLNCSCHHRFPLDSEEGLREERF